MSSGRELQDADAVLDVVDRACPAVARDLIAPLLDFLSQSRSAFSGDIDKLLILMVIAARAAEHPDFAALESRSFADRGKALPSLGTNIRSISDSLQIPRETVRRKVGELAEDGLVLRHNRTLHLASEAFRRYAPLRKAVQNVAVRNYQLVRQLLASET